MPQQTKVVPFEGKDYTFPIDATPQEIADTLNQMTAPLVASGPAPDDRTALQVGVDQAKNVVRGAPQAITGIPGVLQTLAKGMTGNPAETARNIRDMILGAAQPAITSARGALSGRNIQLPVFGASVQVPEYPEGDPSNPAWAEAAQGAGANAAALMLPEIAGRIGKAIPSKARAVAALNEIEGRVGPTTPVDPVAGDVVAQRYQELKAHGNPAAKVLNDYLKERATGNPLTYKTARDFQTSSGAQSVKQATKQNAIIKAKVGEFSNAMKTANREAAANVGMGELFDAAMKEYRQASTIAQQIATLKKWAIPAAATAAATYVGAKKVGGLINRMGQP